MSLPNDTLSRAIAGEDSIFSHIGDVIISIYDGFKVLLLLGLIVGGIIFLVKLLAPLPPLARGILGLMLSLMYFIVVVSLVVFEQDIRAFLIDLLPNTHSSEAVAVGAVSYE